MKIEKVEVLRSKNPVILPEPWRAAWREPSGAPVTQFEFSLYKVYTDDGLIGYGPHTGRSDPSSIVVMDPCYVEALWDAQMSGRRSATHGRGAAGLEIALWDLIGKAAGLPIYKLLGAYTDRIMAYAATSRLMDKEEMVEHVLAIMERGFRAIKLRLHRADPWDDVEVVDAVRQGAGDELMILVDANQNNASDGYRFWSRQTAMRIARALDELAVYYLEEPLPRPDIEGLAEIASSVDMFVAGGEHTPTVYDFREHIVRGAYDIVQPDTILGGNYGITGLRKVALLADYFGRQIVPHVMSGNHFAMGIASTLHAMATVENCPMVEYGYDPPILTPETTQPFLREPILVEPDGTLKVPDGPGLGIDIDEDQFTVVA